MNRLVVNPRTPQAWEIQLKQGINSIGRAAANDFQIHDPSVSGSHCQIIVNGGSIIIKDLGSTNGTFIDQARIDDGTLQEGQSLRLGSVELALHSNVPEAVLIGAVPSARIVAAAAGPAAGPPPPPSAPAMPVSNLRPAGLRRVELATARVAAPPADAPAEAASFATEVLDAPKICKFHPKSAARHFCSKCNRGFCDLCVTSRGERRMCRACGTECIPLQVHAVHFESKGFFARLPGTFVYPFRGTGILILIVSTLVFAGLGMMGGLFSILIKMAAIGYLFSYMQNIIYSTAAEDEQMPELPAMDGLFSAFFTMAGTVLMSFGPAIGLAVALFWVEIPIAAIVVAVIFGCLYFPMAFLAAAMKDTALAANPLVVIPGILKVPLEYIVAVIIMGSIFGVQKLGDVLAGGVKQNIFDARSITPVLIAMGVAAIWSFISVYLMTVNMRILGVLYVTKKDRLQWF